MAYDEIDKSSHVDIIKNPEVKEFLSNCDFMVLPTGKELENVVSNFVEIPATSRKLPGKVLAIDCSNYESSIYSHLPYTRVGYVKLSNLLVDRTIYKGLTAKRFIDPFKVAQFSQDNTAMTFTLPSSNMSFKGEENVRNGFRRALDEQLYQSRFSDDDPKTSIRTTLFHLASLRDDFQTDTVNKLTIHKCPSCKKESIEVFDIPEVQKCPCCGNRIYPSDCLRIWEEVSDIAPNQSALSRFTNAIKHIMVVHYIRHLKENCPQTYMKILENLAFFVNGSLSINGTAAWLKGSIQKYIYKINKELIDNGYSPIMIVGLKKQGKLVDYMRLIKEDVPPNSIFAVSDEFRNTYVDFDKTPSKTTYGNETYYGQDFLMKTATGKVFVFDVPYPFENKENLPIFKVEKSNILNYVNIGEYAALIEDFESDLYESALVPVALAQKYTAISLQPGGKALDLLGQSIIAN